MDIKNIVLIQLDSLRYDIAMKSLENIAECNEGIKDFISEFHTFENAYTTGSNTVHSVPAILSSKYFREYHKEGNHIDEEVLFISDLIKEHGYKTLGVNSNPFLSSYFGYDKHFCRYEDGGSREMALARSGLFNKFKFILTPALPYETVPEIEKKVYQILSHQDTEYFFLWLFFMDTHMPYNNGRGIFSRYRSKYLMSLSQKKNVPEDVKDKIKKLYRESVHYALEKIFEFLVKLSKKGFLEKTLIVITSDHGESFWEHGIYGHHGRFHYQETIRAPLLIRIPGIRGKNHKELVSLRDLAPTILDTLSIRTKSMNGISFLPLIKGNRRYHRDHVITESEINDVDTSKFAVTTLRYKLIFNDEKREFYDLIKDPKERKNIYDEDSPQVKKLDNIGIAHINKHGKYDKTKVSKDIPSEITSRLRALGYLD